MCGRKSNVHTYTHGHDKFIKSRSKPGSVELCPMRTKTMSSVCVCACDCVGQTWRITDEVPARQTHTKHLTQNRSIWVDVRRVLSMRDLVADTLQILFITVSKKMQHVHRCFIKFGKVGGMNFLWIGFIETKTRTLIKEDREFAERSITSTYETYVNQMDLSDVVRISEGSVKILKTWVRWTIFGYKYILFMV